MPVFMFPQIRDAGASGLGSHAGAWEPEKHPLANVRQGAWFGIAKIGVPTIKILNKINCLRDERTHTHFRHAAFRALDKSLITIEVYGTQKDVQSLKDWLPEVSDKAVRDRIKFTLTELEYRLEQE